MKGILENIQKKDGKGGPYYLATIDGTRYSTFKPIDKSCRIGGPVDFTFEQNGAYKNLVSCNGVEGDIPPPPAEGKTAPPTQRKEYRSGDTEERLRSMAVSYAKDLVIAAIVKPKYLLELSELIITFIQKEAAGENKFETMLSPWLLPEKSEPKKTK